MGELIEYEKYVSRARLKTRISRISRISRIFFSSFYKSVFSIFTYSEYRKLGFQKIRDFQTSVFSIFTIGQTWMHVAQRAKFKNTESQSMFKI